MNNATINFDAKLLMCSGTKGVQQFIPFHEKIDKDVTPESFAASKFFHCELVLDKPQDKSDKY